MQRKVTANILPVVVPVANVPTDLKLVPKVSTNEEAPEVVMMNVTSCPATPPEALNVQAPVGVIVITDVTMLTVIVPVVALVAALPTSAPLANVINTGAIEDSAAALAPAPVVELEQRTT